MGQHGRRQGKSGRRSDVQFRAFANALLAVMSGRLAVRETTSTPSSLVAMFLCGLDVTTYTEPCGGAGGQLAAARVGGSNHHLKTRRALSPVGLMSTFSSLAVSQHQRSL